ncbi:DUF512 domain-containing protein [Natranaerofaba carboxydovora]|uniref:DUF512 domain-containing protein n=1 Tax=Natranaerofaba carboxydovora TaxID=2742683 RepID=UPI001F12E007|nr:DUF512 domain-containing protein [Natranaerofaba carboxydovora]UMZ73885.1 hypothetical protein ACONDI_01455 [Natranaerofaba carboxydovora]
MKEHTVKKVYPTGIADEIGLVPGDKIIKINDNYLSDILDYYYHVNDDYLELLVKKKENNENWLIEIEKDFYEYLGVEFELPIMSELKKCKNKCIFCFVDQMPPGLRESLYFKDDDYRLSLLSGNYITLTNLDKEETNRIIEYKISPLYISVHSTNSELRKEMMNNKNAGLIYEQLNLLKESGIEMYGQIVLCPGINDGNELSKTLNDLYKLWPEFKNVAIVPVGLTAHREKLYRINPVDKDKAKELIDQVHSFQEKSKININTRFAFLADEFYILAGEELPSVEEYEYFSQLENGVGLIRKFENEVYGALDKIDIDNTKKSYLGTPTIGSLVTGVSSKPYLSKMVNYITDNYLDVNINVYGIVNNYFGENVTVSGLIAGRDIINQLQGKNIGKYLFVPEVMLKDEGNVFLDDVTIEDIESSLRTNVIKVPVHGEEFVKNLSDLIY